MPSVVVTPTKACWTVPPSWSCSAISIAVFAGIAKPSPMLPACPDSLGIEAIAVLMPITCPAASTSGPPELPGLIAASVWIAEVNVVSEPSVSSPVALTGRSSAETMPVVTVFSRPSGVPRAITGWPTTTVEESAKVAGCRSSGGSSRRITARSVEGSVPTTLAAKLRPSLVVTCRDSASPATWSLVRIVPSSSRTTPVPWLVPEPVEERIETALGETCSEIAAQSGSSEVVVAAGRASEVCEFCAVATGSSPCSWS